MKYLNNLLPGDLYSICMYKLNIDAHQSGMFGARGENPA